MSDRNPIHLRGPAADLVDYQEAAVVSRTLLKGPAGTVTVFAFDAGQELSEHTAPYDALILLLDGSAEVRISGAPHPLVAGDILLLPAHAPHAVRATARFKMILIMLRSQP